MHLRNLTRTAIAAVFCMIGLFGFGCSDSNVTQVVSDGDGSGTESISYLPLEEGYTTVYRVTYPDGSTEMVSVEVGRQVQIGTVEAREWIGTSDEGTDVGYVRVYNDCVYFYESADASAERILALPLAVGESWSRFDDIDDGSGGFIDIITNLDDNTDTDADANAKAYPTEGGDIMTVAGLEEVVLEDGTRYINAVKISNAGVAPGKTNYYWFVTNVGLVKYVLGATDRSYPDGEVVAVLYDCGT